jgi:hypothetical protein
MTADIEDSQTAFLNQLKDRIRDLNEQTLPTSPMPTTLAPKPAQKFPRFIKLVSIDVSMRKIHDEIKQRAEKLADFLKIAVNGTPPSVGVLPGRDFIPNTHVTLVYHSDMSQSDMHAKFGSVIGEEVQLSVTGFLWSDRVAALSVDIPGETKSGSPLHRPKNEFAHITFWCQKTAKAKEANELPGLVDQGKAHKILFEEPFTLIGTVAYWSAGKNSK